MVILVAVFLTITLFLSFVKEFPKINKVLARHPVLMALIPSWNFFAPTPGMHDYHLLFRRIDENEQVHDWLESLPLKEKRGFFAFIWNPNKKYYKCLFDMTQDLLIFATMSNDEKQISLSMPYLHILNYVSSLSHDNSIKKIQFMILSSSRLHDYKVEFVSSVHPLPG